MTKPLFQGRRRLLVTSTASLVLAASQIFPAWADDPWPSRPVKIIISQTPGTSIDTAARLISERLSAMWKQGVIVDNRSGGQNIVGSQAAARSTPDGYTFFLGTTAALVMNPLTFKSLPYAPEKDFVPVAMVAKSPMALAVSNAVPARSMAELVALGRNRPGSLSLANEGSRTLGGLVSQALGHASGMKMENIPYNSINAALQDTIAGRTQAVLGAFAVVAPMHRRGELRMLAVSSPQRISSLPDIPTLSESYPGLEFVGWFGLVAPTGTPPEIVAAVNRDVNAVLADPALAQRLSTILGISELGSGPPSALADFLSAERARWRKLVDDIGFQPE